MASFRLFLRRRGQNRQRWLVVTEPTQDSRASAAHVPTAFHVRFCKVFWNIAPVAARRHKLKQCFFIFGVLRADAWRNALQDFAQDRLVRVLFWKRNGKARQEIAPHADRDQTLALLRYAVIPCVQHLFLDFVAAFGKHVQNRAIRPPIVMRQKTADVLEKERLRLQLFQKKRVVVEERSSRILQSEPLACIGKRLAGSAARQEVEFSFFQAECLQKVERGQGGNVLVEHVPLRAVCAKRRGGVFIDLHQGDGRESRPLSPERKPARARKEFQAFSCHLRMPSPCLTVFP